jgi:hypothetical protein
VQVQVRVTQLEVRLDVNGVEVSGRRILFGGRSQKLSKSCYMKSGLRPIGSCAGVRTT